MERHEPLHDRNVEYDEDMEWEQSEDSILADCETNFDTPMGAIPQAEMNEDEEEMEHCSLNEELMEIPLSGQNQEMKKWNIVHWSTIMQCTDQNLEIGPALATSYPNTISPGGTQPKECENVKTSNQENVLTVNYQNATSQMSVEVKLPRRVDAINIDIVNQGN